MKKYIIVILLCLFITNVYAFDFKLESKNILVVNLNDNSILYEKNSDDIVSIASLTKIVTSLVIIENHDLNENVTINYKVFEDIKGYSQVGFKTGDVVTVEELLYGLLLPSGADAANALAYYDSNNYEQFAIKMNSLVKKIGCSNTSFTNPIGKDDANHYSTPKDLVKILEYALKNDTFKKIFTSKSYYIKSIDKTIYSTLVMAEKEFKLDASIIDGSKTGHTSKAGSCMISYIDEEDIDFIIVNLGSGYYDSDYVKDTLKLGNYYINNYSYQTVIKDKEILKTVEVEKSKQKTYDVISSKDYKYYLENDSKLSYKYDGIELIEKGTKKGSKLGKITIYNDDEVLESFDVFLNEDIVYNKPIIVYIGIVILVLFIINFIYQKMKKYKRV